MRAGHGGRGYDGAVPSPCCPRSFAGSMRPCPRCSKWICHNCGVPDGGKLVCPACVGRPDPVREEADLGINDLVGLTQVPRALAGGVAGSLLGGLAWGGLAAVLGTSLGVFGVLAGLGARLGVRAALPWRSGCAWPFVSAAAVLPGYALGRWLTAVVAARAVAGGSVGLFDRAVWSALGDIVFAGYGLLEACWIGCALLAAVVRLRR